MPQKVFDVMLRWQDLPAGKDLAPSFLYSRCELLTIFSFVHRSLASALKLHEDEIFSQIKQDGITELVFTGHSLGGGIAQVAHLLAKAQSRYSKLESLKTVAFAAPMAIMKVEVSGNETSEELLKDVGNNSINFVFSLDAVPRGYNNVLYTRKVLYHVIQDLVSGKGASVKGVAGAVQRLFDFTKTDVKMAQLVLNYIQTKVTPLIPTAVEYRHVATLLYYHNDKTEEPKKVTDTGPSTFILNEKLTFAEDPHNWQESEVFHHYSFEKYEEELGLKKGNYVVKLLEAHSYFPAAFAPYIIP